MLYFQVVQGKDYVITSEFTSFKASLSVGGVVQGVIKAREVSGMVEKLPISVSDKNYLRKQLRQPLFRISRIEEQMVDIGIIRSPTDFRIQKKRSSGSQIIWNPFPSLLGPVFNFLGAESTNNFESYKEHTNGRLDVLELHEKFFSNSIKELDDSAVKSFKSFNNNLERLENSTKTVKQTNRVSSDLTNLADIVEHGGEVVVEVKDRADLSMVSRNVVTKSNLAKMNIFASDKYPFLKPIFQNKEVDRYYQLPLAITGYWPETEEFITTMHLPLVRESDRYHSVSKFKSFLHLENSKWSTQLLYSDANDCFHTNEFILCGKRVCKVSKRSSGGVIKSCMIHGDQNVEIVFHNDTIGRRSSEIEIDCTGGLKKMISIEKQIVHFKLPKECEASNQHLTIHRVVTADLGAHEFPVRNMSIGYFELDDIMEEDLTKIISNKATKEVIKNLKEEGEIAGMMEASIIRETNSRKYMEDGANETEKFKYISYICVAVGSLGIVCYIVHLVKKIKNKCARG